MSTFVFGFEIELADQKKRVAANTTYGLYNVNSLLVVNASGNSIRVVNYDRFRVGELLYIEDNTGGEYITVKRIGADTLYLYRELSRTYTSALSTVHGTSRFRWLQNTIPGITGWNVSMLLKEGIGNFTRSCPKLVAGGTVSEPGKCNVRVTNSDAFNQFLLDNGITINGLRSFVYEYDGSAFYRRWAGICERPTFSGFEYSILSKGSFLNKRRANLTKQTNKSDYPYATDDIIGDAIPVSIGRMKYAKFVRVADFTKSYTAIELNSTAYPYLDTIIFPIVNVYTAPSYTYDITIANGGGVGGWNLSLFVGKYLHVVTGTASNGEYRKITSATPVDGKTITIAIAEYFSTALVGNSTATATGNTWVEIVETKQSFSADLAQCKSLMDADGNEVINEDEIELYSYDSVDLVDTDTSGTLLAVDKSKLEYIRIPSYAYKLNSTTKNNIDISSEAFDGSTDKVNSFLTLPVVNPRLKNDESSLASYGGPGELLLDDGLYGHISSGSANVSTAHDIANITDKTDAYYSIFLNVGNNNIGYGADGVFSVVMKFGLPPIPKGFKFDSCYFGMKIGVEVFYPEFPILTIPFQMGVNSSFYTHYRRFMGTHTNINNDVWKTLDASGMSTPDGDFTMQSIPGTYIGYGSLGPSFYPTTLVGGRFSGGYQNFSMLVSNQKDYEAIKEMVIIFQYQNGMSADYTIEHKIYELGIIFQKSLSIRDAIYAPFAGRVFNDTFDNRKTITDLIEKPKDLFEHVCRLQNMNECSPTPTLGWGLSYVENPLINLSKSTLATISAAGQTNVAVSPSYGSVFRPRQIINIKDNLHTERSKIVSVTGDTLVLENNLVYSYNPAYNGMIFAEGCFDDPDLISWNESSEVAGQITEYDKAYTDTIKNDLCQDYMLLSWVDGDGFENLKRINKEDVSPPDELLLSSIVNRKSIEITEANPSDVYAEPMIQFDKDAGSERFQGIMRVRNTGAVSFSTNYVDGLSTSDAEQAWNTCASFLWPAVKEIAKVPEEFSDLSFVKTNEIAKQLFFEKIEWLNNSTIRIDAPYYLVRDWYEGHEFTIKLPHYTNNVSVECRLIEIEHSPNFPNISKLTAIIWREEIPSEFFLQDTVTQYGNDDDLIDTVTEYGNDNDLIDNV